MLHVIFILTIPAVVERTGDDTRLTVGYLDLVVHLDAPVFWRNWCGLR